MREGCKERCWEEGEHGCQVGQRGRAEGQAKEEGERWRVKKGGLWATCTIKERLGFNTVTLLSEGRVLSLSWAEVTMGFPTTGATLYGGQVAAQLLL